MLAQAVIPISRKAEERELSYLPSITDEAASVQQLIDSKDVVVVVSAVLAWTVLSFHCRE